jgi:hypothetical protein
MIKGLPHMKLPIGISDFKELIEGKYHFADKTLLIKEIIDDGAKVLLITRPRRFGKTLNMSMIYYFLELNHNQDLFNKLYISKEVELCKTHQNKYPIIFISFKDIKKSTYIEAYKNIERLIADLYARHIYLLDGEALYDYEKIKFNSLLNQTAESADLENSIAKLCEYLSRKFNQNPIILIDEYDTPIQEAYKASNSETITENQDSDTKYYYQKMIELMRSILGQALKDNQYLSKAVITGITRISQESLFSGLNNIKVYSLLQEKLGGYFGFNEEEVSRFIAATKQTVSVDSIKEWYNGYRIGKHTLYNPWSIINCLDNNGELKPYWLNTGGTDLLNILLGKANIDVKQQFEKLLQNKTISQPISEDLVFPDLETREEALWSLLLYTGYLNIISSELQGRRLVAEISIPNKEVGFVYDKIIEQWFSDSVSLNFYDQFIMSLRNGDMIKFKAYLSTYIMQSGSYFDFNTASPEQIFHVFILGLVVGLRDQYIINSNQESGLGRYDVIFLPKDKKKNGIVLEFKISPTPELLQDGAEKALKQIKDKQYTRGFEQHGVSSVLAIGLCFCGKQMALVYEVIRL